MKHVFKAITPFSLKWNILLAVIILLKAVLLAVFSSEYNSGLFHPFLEVFVTGAENPWQYYYENALNLDAFPYHAFMLGVLSIPAYFIELFNIENETLQNFIFKLPLLIADLGLFFALLKLHVRKENKVFFFYFLNPIVFYAIYIHSQLDIIPMFLLMTSLYFLLRNRLLPFSLFLGFAIATKLNVLVVIPLLFFYLLKNHSFKVSFLYLLLSIAILIAIDLPFLSSTGFQEMVLFNSKQSLLFASFLEIGDLKLLLPVASIVTVYLHFYYQKKVNYDLLSFYLGLLFTASIFFVYPAPAWYIWLVPFVSIFFIQTENFRRAVFLHSIFSIVYLTFFIFFYKSDYQDLIFQGAIIDLKNDSEQLRNLSFTFMEVCLLAMTYAFYKYGIKSNSVYKMKSSLTIGIGGDSSTGKSTLLDSLEGILGSKLLKIEGDGEHKWERGDENWSKFTHLDPKANFVHKQADAIKELKMGNSIKRSDYNHDTGTFTKAFTVRPREFIAISGLHPFYLPKLRKSIDLKIYMDTEEELRRHWKIIRDTKNRGYSRDRIIKQIETRVNDSNKYIYPQKEFANLIIHYFGMSELPNTEESFMLGLRLTFDASVHIEEILQRLNCEYTWDYNDDLQSQFVELQEIPEVNFHEIAVDTIRNIDEIISEDPRWESGYEGLIQLIALKMISEYLQEL